MNVRALLGLSELHFESLADAVIAVSTFRKVSKSDVRRPFCSVTTDKGHIINALAIIATQVANPAMGTSIRTLRYGPCNCGRL